MKSRAIELAKISLEESIKSQFTQVFAASDSWLFKKLAESNLREAATLLKADMRIEPSLKLLARNSRKRLLIGVGVELLLKAVYLKQGYAINKPPKSSQLNFPFRASDAVGVQLAADRTYTLNELIDNLPRVLQLQNKTLTLKGFKIAKVFRNKEGHGVTTTHRFDPSNYADIASSLVALYQDAFEEILSVRFSVAPNEGAIWRVSRPSK